MSGKRLAKRLLFIGWDGAEPDTLRLLLEAGRLPHLRLFVDSGASLVLDVPRPLFPQATWSSLATGKRPHEHGVLHAYRKVGDGPELRPITRYDRKCSAVWNVLSRAGLRTHVLGWPVTHPAEKVSGIFVSDCYAAGPRRGSYDLRHGSAVMPSSAVQILEDRRMAPQQVEPVTLAQLFPPRAIGVGAYSKLESTCREILAQAATIFRSIRWCLDAQPWDFAACVFPGFRHCHQLAKLPYSFSSLAPELCELLIAGCYEHHDLLVGQLLSQIDDATHVLFVSPSPASNSASYETSESNPRAGSGTHTNALAVMSGPKVCPSAGTVPRSLLDIAPTILAMFGIPYAEDMGGRPLQDVFEDGLPTDVIGSWDVGSTGETVQPKQVATSNGQNATDPFLETQHLTELGYTDPLDTIALEAAVQCQRTTDLNRAISLMDAGLLTQAATALEQLTREHPNWLRSRSFLAETYFRAGRHQAAREQLDWLTCHGFENPHLYLLSAAVESADRQFDRALEMANCARRGAVIPLGWSLLTGTIYLRKRDLAAAAFAFKQALETEGRTAPALDGMASAKLHQHEYEEAAVYALDALECDMRLAKAHYHLAVALYFLDRPQESLQALTIWSSLEPHAAAPYRWMARVHGRSLHDSGRAEACLHQGRRVIRLRREVHATAREEDTSTRFSAP